MITTEDLERAIDETLAPRCGGCGQLLPQPGLQCPGCGAWPDITREEAAAALSAPGELTLLKADAARRQALDTMHAFIAATAVPDRLRKRADVEQTQAEVQQALAQVSQEHAAASQRYAETQAAVTAARAPLDDALGDYRAAQAALEEAERTLAGPKPEIKARRDIAAAQPVVDKYQRLYDQATAKAESARLEKERCDLMISMAEQARDEQAGRLLHVDEVRPTPERLRLLAQPLVMLVDEVITDHESANPQYGDEWANVLALIHQLAGAVGLLAMAEEGATPRVLGELTGPLSRADDVADIQRRLAGSRLQLPPSPGEASMTLVRNTIQ